MLREASQNLPSQKFSSHLLGREDAQGNITEASIADGSLMKRNESFFVWSTVLFSLRVGMLIRSYAQVQGTFLGPS